MAAATFSDPIASLSIFMHKLIFTFRCGPRSLISLLLTGSLILSLSSPLCAQQRGGSQGGGGFGGFGGFGGGQGGNRSGSSGTSSSQYNNNGTVGTATITVDPQTHNLIVITDAATSLQISNVISNLDTPKPQVLINVVFVEVQRNNSSDIGVEGGGQKIMSVMASQLELDRSSVFLVSIASRPMSILSVNLSPLLSQQAAVAPEAAVSIRSQVPTFRPLFALSPSRAKLRFFPDLLSSLETVS